MVSVLGNLDPKLRSSLKSIQLLCVAKYPIVVKLGIEEVLKPIVEDTKALEKVNLCTSLQCYLIG